MNLRPSDVMELLADCPKNQVIGDNLVRAWSKINSVKYKVILCSISGGSDSDVMLDICYRCDKDNKVNYIWFDTGLEYRATKDHLKYLEEKYDIKFTVYKAAKAIPTCCKEYGQPFLSKQVSEFISRLQKHDFQWEDKSFEELYKEYPKCKSALEWWCGKKGKNSRFGIDRNKYLKKFLVANPPDFKISNKCCYYAKKLVSKHAKQDFNCDLSIIGVRKSEGGVRASAYKSCFTCNNDTADEYRPLFWYKNTDKEEYDEHYGIVHSKCYTEYGLSRTGCAGCPFGRNFEYELEVIKKYEPKLYVAVNNIFGKSYEYTRKYREFCKIMDEE